MAGDIIPVPDAINFNLWFIKDGAVKARDVRRYTEEIDWVFFEQNPRLSWAKASHRKEALSPEQVEARVAAPRQAGSKFCR